MYYFYGKINWGHVVCPLYEGGLYLGESVIGGSTVLAPCSYLPTLWSAAYSFPLFSTISRLLYSILTV